MAESSNGFLLEASLPAEDLETYAPAILELKTIDGLYVPFQNGIPYSSFEWQASRQHLNLSGTWKVLYDPSASSETSLKPRTPSVLEQLTESGFQEPSYDDNHWEIMQVPSSNNVRGGLHEGYEGVVWYRRRFHVPHSMEGKFVRLIFQGSNYFTDVWVNGAHLGYHEGGFTPFAFDATSYFNYGEDNLIAVRVDNIRWGTVNSIVPIGECDWWNYGGIYRDIYLEAMPPLNIARVDLVPKKLNETYDIEAKIIIANHDDEPHDANVALQLFKANVTDENILSPSAVAIADLDLPLLTPIPSKRIHVNAKQARALQFSFTSLNLTPWHPSNPKLYVAGALLSSDNGLVDEFYTQFGAREIKTEGFNLTLDGNSFFFKGMARHEDYPETGRTVTIESIFSDLQIFKEANANWIRTAHYPNHPHTYILTDRMGLAVWEEIPVYWFGGEAFDIQVERGIAKQMWLEMIFRDFNRPSILVWGAANECGSYAERIRFLSELAELAEKIDPTRLTAQAAAWDLDDDTWERSGLDIIGVNEYFGVFYGSLYDLNQELDNLRNRFPDTPILITEFGIWSGGANNEQVQASYFEESYEVLSRKPYIAGVTWWTAIDYYSSINRSNLNTFGALNWDRSRQKYLYGIIKEAFSKPRVISSNGTEGPFSQTIITIAAIAIALCLFLTIMARRFLQRSAHASTPQVD